MYGICIPFYLTGGHKLLNHNNRVDKDWIIVYDIDIVEEVLFCLYCLDRRGYGKKQ